MAEVLAALREHGLADACIRSSWYDVTPQRDHKRARLPVVGYRAAHRVEVTVEPVERAGELIDAATAAGASDVDLVCFDVADRSTLERDARAPAMADARAKAAHLAELAGRHLGKVVRITARDSRPYRMYARGHAEYPHIAHSPGYYPTELRPGTVEFSMTVSVTFALED